jgi:Fe-S oxidoreductase
VTLSPFNREVTYHDPCHLGRHSGVYIQPRNLIKAIPQIDFEEMQRNKEFSWCCESGAGIKTYEPQLAVRIAEERVKEANGRIIISTCPYCEANLKDAGGACIDLVELYAQVLQSGRSEKEESEYLDAFICYLRDHTEIVLEIKKCSILLYEIGSKFFTIASRETNGDQER